MRENKKISPFHMKQILYLRNHQQLSYSKIGQAMTLKPETIYHALKRYNKRGEFVDNRIHNGRNNPKHKIGADLRRRLLDRDLL